MANKITSLVYTVRNRCRVCYTCVRECPAKAIRIVNGQAEVIHERCIACGTCTKVCSQGAKEYLSSTKAVENLLASDEKVIACLAPSFPAEFDRLDYRELIGMIKQLGFYKVTEVAFGADIVAHEYKNLFEKADISPYISANCPAIVHYIKHYHPELIKSVAPVISPMVAMARVVRKKYGENSHVIFIGPCVAKKTESEEIDETLTFVELRQMLEDKKNNFSKIELSDFDPPIGSTGAILPISRGMIQSVGIEDNVLDGNVIVAEGRINFQDAIKEFEAGLLKTKHLDLLCCEGCIMGPGMSKKGKQYARQIAVSNYVRNKITNFDKNQWEKDFDTYKDIDLKRTYKVKDRRFPIPLKSEIETVLHRLGKYSLKDHLNCGACGYETCMEHAVAIIRGLAEEEMCLPFSIDKLHNSVNELAVSNEKLASMKEALKHSEKLASMGQLSAGIAHELNNPLGVVIMYSNILLEEADPNTDFYEDLKLIVEQADRCRKIVGGLLNFARKNQVKYHEVDAERIAKQSLTSLILPKNIKLKFDFDCEDPVAMLDAEQIIQVLNNLVKNAVEAMPKGGVLTLRIEDDRNNIRFLISDTGIGIPKEEQSKIFEPFFTTKGIGKGTGLGLATTYGIVKMHKGQISVKSNDKEGETGTTFIVSIPRHKII